MTRQTSPPVDEPATVRPKALSPPQASCSLYVGPVMHARLKPVGHRFTYKVFSILLDIDRIDEATRPPIFSHNRFNLFSFRDRDHGRRDGSPLRTYVNDELTAAGIDNPPARILLLCYPRVLGYVFNPISIYYCYDEDDALVCLIYEVRNTFGGLHTYTMPVRPGEISPAGIRQERDKAFYVSPFIEMTMRYAFRITQPSDDLRVRILERDADGPLLSATFSGERRPATSAEFLKLFFLVPFASLKIISAIHFEAIRLWLKGVAPVPRSAPKPIPPRPVSHPSGD